jgi:alkylation response protein AidB-like acyl-CoA dehydrogenase
MLKRTEDVEAPRVDCVARARQLAPVIAAAAPRIERAGALPADVIEAMHASGLFRLFIPRRYGGEEVEPLAFVQAVEEVAKADASTAWCMAQTSGSSLAAGFLVPQTADEIFGDPCAVIASGPAGPPRATAVDGGFRITGSWPFASGITHATWLAAHCLVNNPDGSQRFESDGRPMDRTLLFPKSQASITPAWDVIGLRGTGSYSYAVTDLFVPEARSWSRGRPHERREQSPLYRFTMMNIFGFGFAGVALGLARAELAAFVRLAGVKKPQASAKVLRDDPVVQHTVAATEVKLRAARAFLMEALRDAWAAATERDFTTEQCALMRMASIYVIQQAREVVEAAYQAAGATAIFADQDFERRFRDMHTVSQQIQAHTSFYQVAGRYLLEAAAEDKP